MGGWIFLSSSVESGFIFWEVWGICRRAKNVYSWQKFKTIESSRAANGPFVSCCFQDQEWTLKVAVVSLPKSQWMLRKISWAYLFWYFISTQYCNFLLNVSSVINFAQNWLRGLQRMWVYFFLCRCLHAKLCVDGACLSALIDGLLL